jgi:hypothetical protein
MAKRSPKRTSTKSPGKVTCSCLLLCDDVVQTHALDKHHLQGVIGAITCVVAPNGVGLGGPCVAYVRLSNVHANERVTVAFEHGSGTKVWELEAQLLNRNDPLAVHTLIARVAQFPIQEEGRHLLVVRHGAEEVAHAPIQVKFLRLEAGI